MNFRHLLEKKKHHKTLAPGLFLKEVKNGAVGHRHFLPQRRQLNLWTVRLIIEAASLSQWRIKQRRSLRCSNQKGKAVVRLANKKRTIFGALTQIEQGSKTHSVSTTADQRSWRHGINRTWLIGRSVFCLRGILGLLWRSKEAEKS